MEIVGYCQIKKDATSGRSAIALDEFKGKFVRVLEFGHDGCVLVIDGMATGLATFDKEDVVSKVNCSIFGEVVCPPNLNVIQKTAYVAKCLSRKGGYSSIFRNMVIAASLAKGEFYDDFLWQNQ